MVAPPGTVAGDLGLAGIPVVHGDHRRARVLREAGAERAAAVVLAATTISATSTRARGA